MEAMGIPLGFISGTLFMTIIAVILELITRDEKIPKIRWCYNGKGKRNCEFKKEINDVLKNERYAFVSIPYNGNPESMFRKCVSETITELGFVPKLAKDEPRSGYIPCKICRLIQKSYFVITDITGANPNVLHELGLAQGVSRRIIIRDENDKDQIPLNIQSLEYLAYNHNEEETFKKQLSEMIKITLAGDKTLDFSKA